jgi:hypothetical protein
MEKVRDVVMQLLSQYGAAHLISHVKAKDVNYYGHPGEIQETLDTIADTVLQNDLACHYKRLFAETFNSQLDSCDKKFAEITIGTFDQNKIGTIPGFYLWLLFEYVTDQSAHASVVTSSFYTDGGGFDVATGLEIRQWPALVAAVLNPDRFPPTYANKFSYEQPQKQFFDKNQKYGTFLIGATLRDGSVFGMTSSETDDDPDAVTAFGPGEGYGNIDSVTGCWSSCIRSADRGTSFAAPAIAVQLYLARALWRTEASKRDPSAPLLFGSSRDYVDVMEAKRRLALSADVVPALVGKAAAAGTPRFERLIAPRGDVFITRDNLVQSGVVISARMMVDGHFLDYGDRKHGIGGIQVHNGLIFVYDEAIRSWRKADDGGFYIQLQDGTVFDDPSKFSAAYISIARYQ